MLVSFGCAWLGLASLVEREEGQSKIRGRDTVTMSTTTTAKFDDETGAALNAEAHEILERARKEREDSSMGTSKGQSSSTGGGGGSVLDSVPTVDIAQVQQHTSPQLPCQKPTTREHSPHGCPASFLLTQGKWKYVAIDIYFGGDSKRIVRSYAGLSYHPENYDRAMRILAPQGIRGSVVGGGRILYEPTKQEVKVYGYSKSFGRAPGCNERSAELIREAFPDYDVTWTDDGY